MLYNEHVGIENAVRSLSEFRFPGFTKKLGIAAVWTCIDRLEDQGNLSARKFVKSLHIEVHQGWRVCRFSLDALNRNVHPNTGSCSLTMQRTLMTGPAISSISCSCGSR